jgi:hypothetical protein
LSIVAKSISSSSKMQSKLAAMRSGLFDLGITETPRLIMKHRITCAGVLLYFFAIDAIYSSLTGRMSISKFLLY